MRYKILFAFLFLIIYLLLLFILASFEVISGGLFVSFSAILLVLCYFIVGIIHNIFTDIYDKKNPFKQFEKKELPKNNEIIITTLKKIKSKQYILPIKNGVIAVNGSGVHVIKLFQASGHLKYDKKWYFDSREINNPFDYKGDYYYLIRNIGTTYELNGINVVNLTELLFKIENSLIIPKYTDEQIDIILKEVQYGYNKN